MYIFFTSCDFILANLSTLLKELHRCYPAGEPWGMAMRPDPRTLRGPREKDLQEGKY